MSRKLNKSQLQPIARITQLVRDLNQTGTVAVNAANLIHDMIKGFVLKNVRRAVNWGVRKTDEQDIHQSMMIECFRQLKTEKAASGMEGDIWELIDFACFRASGKLREKEQRTYSHKRLIGESDKLPAQLQYSMNELKSFVGPELASYVELFELGMSAKEVAEALSVSERTAYARRLDIIRLVGEFAKVRN